MIKALSHATIYVLDQDAALAFYRDKLGFEVRTDATMGDFRWVTVGPKEQKNLEIVLFQLRVSGMHDEATVAQLRELVAKGALGAGVFETADVRATYEELKAKGVEFMGEPAERPYGIEAIMKDNSGNWFSLCQPR
jgi:catechol 2,3-dioxygenase-like lactoylglutathione lyase family enzyme